MTNVPTYEEAPLSPPAPRVWEALQAVLSCDTFLSLAQTLLQHLTAWPPIAKATLVLYHVDAPHPSNIVYHVNPALSPAGTPLTWPLTYAERPIALLALDPAAGHTLPPEVLQAVEALCRLVTPGLAHLQALEAEKLQRLIADAFCAVSAEIATVQDERTFLLRILDYLQRFIPFDRAALFEWRNGALHCIQSYDKLQGARDELPMDEPFAPLLQVVRTRQALVLPQSAPMARPTSTTERVSWMGVPLMLQGELWGVIGLESSTPRAFEETHVQMASLFAEQVALALENRRLYREERERREEMEAIQRFNLLVAAELELEALQAAITYAVQGLVQAQHVRLFLHADEAPDPSVRAALQEARPWLTPDEERLSDVRWVLPLHLGARVVGALDVRWAPASYRDAYLARLNLLAPQVAVALENARLYQEALQAGQRRAVLHAVGQEIISAVRDLPSLYQAIHRATQELMPCDAFLLALVTEDEQAIEVVYAVDRGQVYTGVRAPRGQGLSWHVVTTGQALLLAEQDETEVGLKAIQVGEEAVRSLLFVPMRLEQRILGVLSAQSYRPNAYQPDDIVLLEMLAAQAAIAIENARLLQQTQRRAAFLETQNAIIAAANAAEDLPALLSQVLDLVMETLQTPLGGIWIGENYAVRGLPNFEIVVDEARRYSAQLELRTPITVSDWQQTPLEGLRAQTGPFLMHLGFRASLTIPIQTQGQTIGGMLVGGLQPRVWTAEEVALAETVGNQLGAVVRRLQLLAQVREQAQELAQYSRSLEEQVRARTRELERAYQTVSEQHARLDAILRHITDGLILTDLDGRIELANPAFCAIVGRDAAGLIGVPLQDILPYPPLLEAIGQAQAVAGAGGSVDYLHPPRIYRCTSVALSGQGPFNGRVVTVFHDITVDVEMARMKDDFVSTVSHELRTPMTSILGFSQLIGRQFKRHIVPKLAQDDPQVQKAIARIQENLDIIAQEGARLTRLVNDILDLAKMEAGRMEWKTEPFALPELIQTTLAALRSLMSKSRASRRSCRSRRYLEIRIASSRC